MQTPICISKNTFIDFVYPEDPHAPIRLSHRRTRSYPSATPEGSVKNSCSPQGTGENQVEPSFPPIQITQGAVESSDPSSRTSDDSAVTPRLGTNQPEQEETPRVGIHSASLLWNDTPERTTWQPPDLSPNKQPQFVQVMPIHSAFYGFVPSVHAAGVLYPPYASNSVAQYGVANLSSAASIQPEYCTDAPNLVKDQNDPGRVLQQMQALAQRLASSTNVVDHTWPGSFAMGSNSNVCQEYQAQTQAFQDCQTRGGGKGSKFRGSQASLWNPDFQQGKGSKASFKGPGPKGVFMDLSKFIRK